MYYILHQLLEQKSPSGLNKFISEIVSRNFREGNKITEHRKKSVMWLGINALLYELCKHICDDNETQIPETQDNHDPKSKES